MSKVVIIGSGLGGLSCGYILQKNGYDVTILEQGIQLGGCLQCFVRKGAKFETGMHFIGSALPGQTMGRMFNFLDINDQIKLSALDEDAYNTVSLAGSRFTFPNGREAFLDRMSSYFPEEKDALRKYVEIIEKISAASSLNSLTSVERDLAANTEFQLRTINDVLDELFTDEMLKNVLVGDLSLYSAEYDKTPFSQHAFIMDFYNQSAFRIAGGSDSIAFALINNIERLGGKVLSKKKVIKVHCDDIKATGVETADEQFYPADYVISAVHPNRLLEMLDTKLIRPAFRNRISSIPQTAGSFSVYVKFKEATMPYMNTNYYGYSGKSPWGCEHYTLSDWPKGFLYMHMCHEDQTIWAKSGVVISYMNMEDVIQWKGTKIGRRGEDYEAFKKLHAELLIDDVEKHHPGFKNSIENYYTSTPLTYLDYTGTEKGSMYGVAKDINLGPAGRVPYRTKIPNLFLAGQNVNSHGMLGVLVGTIVTCSELISAETIYKQIDESNRK
jgi:all-trans-retinol 13,14-reductase